MKKTILNQFLKNRDLVNKMRNCLHSEVYLNNKYHLEDDCWAHTMLVYNQAHPDNYIELIMALCHDIGKIYTRKYNPEKKKVTMYSHSDASVLPTINFLYDLYINNILTGNQIKEFINIGLPAMANHMVYYQNIDKQLYFSFNKDPVIQMPRRYYFNRMEKIDREGSIGDKDQKIDYNIKYKEYYHKEINPDLPTITIWSGLPGSGKDYLAKQTGNPIVSFDDIRIKLFKEKHFTYGLTDIEIYYNAFHWCNDNKIDLNNYLSKEIKSHNTDINISNTSLTRKSRRKLINVLNPNKYNFIINQVFVPEIIIKQRNKERNSKHVPEKVIDKMSKNIHVATHFEDNINEINYFFNI